MVSVSPVPPVLPVTARCRRRVLTALAVTACLLPLTAVPAAAAGAMPPPVRPEDRASGAMPPPVRPEDQGDHLTVVVRHAGVERDGKYDLYCHPEAGRHPDPAEACRVLDENTRWGRDPFPPVAPGTVCTMVHGGPATARITGTWAGRPVDATYDRGDGCRIARWDHMVPLLPRIGAATQAAPQTDAPAQIEP
ncbi:SSI family serine proteinase inhibitor [Streptomyces sp. CSDS2]|uniref:SSI family serine proteinase inhibitor n=1 Tax=Streptomyces sp. CSDS2 TaxID=3055051 RepID=UPI0025B07D86|nr:SSI family serine proteinase inhibitor [Streptomyces sp. CSDS2]MDN3265478.1 SSI family serine proteinase inhibitor [Streptomyces sp. CSDS2]